MVPTLSPSTQPLQLRDQHSCPRTPHRQWRQLCLCLHFWHGLLLAQIELFCVWDGQHPTLLLPDGCTAAGLPLATRAPVQHGPAWPIMAQRGTPGPGCGRCCSLAGGGCFYQQPWSGGFSLISFSSFLQPWICIRSWVRTNLIPGWEHCIRPSESSMPNCLWLGCVGTGKQNCAGTNGSLNFP